MGQRIRYFATSPYSRAKLKNAGDTLSALEYTDAVAWGFIDVRNEGAFVSGTFVERFETEEEVTHPFGHVTLYKRVRFNQVKFHLGLNVPQLEILDASRS